MHSRLRSDLQKGLLVAALVVGAGTAVARELDTRARREARAAVLVSESGEESLQSEAAAALSMARGVRTPEALGGVAGLTPTPRLVSVATAGQAMFLGLRGAHSEPPPNAALVADVRAGASVDPTVWSTPGLAGLAALEAGRAGRVDLVSMLVSMAAKGPSEPDRLAALFALRRLGYDPDGRPVAESHSKQVVQ